MRNKTAKFARIARVARLFSTYLFLNLFLKNKKIRLNWNRPWQPCQSSQIRDRTK